MNLPSRTPRPVALRRGGAVTGVTQALGWGALVVWVAFTSGGFFANSWGPTALAVLAVGSAAAVWRADLRVSRPAGVFVGMLAALTLWTAFSGWWSPDRAAAADSTLRDVLYVAVALVTVVLATRRSLYHTQLGLAAGVTVQAAFGDLTRFAPERTGLYSDALAPVRLFAPTGYWDAQGTLAAFGLILALGACLQGKRPPIRAAAGAAVPICAVNLYLTYSRGGIAVLAIGWVTMVLLARGRKALVSTSLVLAFLTSPLLIVVYRHRALFGNRFGLGSATVGNHLTVYCAVTMIATGVAAAVLPRLAPAWTTGMRGRRYGSILAIPLVAAAIGFAAIVHVHSTDAGSSARTGTPPKDQTRLLSESLNGREQIWKVALHDWRTDPLAGIGAGGFEESWDRLRTTPVDIAFAHSVYLQALAELGLIGAALLVIACATPLVRIREAARLRGGAPMAACYVAYLVHTGVDWDWQMPLVTIVAIVCGGSLLYHRPSRERPGRPWMKTTVVVCCGLLALVSVVGWIANQELSASRSDAAAGRWRAAENEAKAAQTWQPWSSAPALQLALARVGAGNVAEARSSFAHAASLSPASWEAWFGLAQTSTGEQRRAALLKASHLNPLGLELRWYCRASRPVGCPATIPRSLSYSAG